MYKNTPLILENHILNNPSLAAEALRLHIVMRKLERIGDHCSNIIEELVFYVDAKVLKHTKHNTEQ